MTTNFLYLENKNLDAKDKELFFQMCESIKQAKLSSN